MLTPRIPLELQLLVIDLAIPPRTFYRAFHRDHDQKRRDIRNRFALVSRAWHSHTRRLGEGQLVFDLTDPSTRFDMFDDIAWPLCRIRRLDLSADIRTTDCWEDIAIFAASEVPGLEELSLRRYVSKVDSADDFRKVEAFTADARPSRQYDRLSSLDSLPHSLRFLSISGYRLSIRNQTQISRLPHLDTLLLELATLERDESQPQLVLDLLLKPRLRLLGLRRVSGLGIKSDTLTAISTKVQHLALASVSLMYLWIWRRDGIELSSHLKSLTIVVCPPVKYDIPLQVPAAINALSVACSAASVKLTIKRCTTAEELSQFDMEEWASTVDS